MEKIIRRGQGYNIDCYWKCYSCGQQIDIIEKGK